MVNLVENLKPPFYIAIINDNVKLNPLVYDASPTDTMVSIAPHQSGFLGLEAARDYHGKWVTISYWSDIDSEKAWEHKSDIQIRKHFDGIDLKKSCTINVSKINHKLGSSKKLYGNKLVTSKILSSSICGFVSLLYSALTNMFVHKPTNQLKF
jgi:hypothetical protein